MAVNAGDRIVRTRLEDLQAEIEAGSRTVDTLAAALRDAIVAKHLEQADIAGRLVRQVAELRSSIRQQREILRELRHAIRERIARRPTRR